MCVRNAVHRPLGSNPPPSSLAAHLHSPFGTRMWSKNNLHSSYNSQDSYHPLVCHCFSSYHDHPYSNNPHGAYRRHKYFGLSPHLHCHLLSPLVRISLPIHPPLLHCHHFSSLSLHHATSPCISYPNHHLPFYLSIVCQLLTGQIKRHYNKSSF